MDNIFVVGCVISTVFFLVKFIEMRFSVEEPRPLKYLMRDTLVVYASCIIGYYLKCNNQYYNHQYDKN